MALLFWRRGVPPSRARLKSPNAFGPSPQPQNDDIALTPFFSRTRSKLSNTLPDVLWTSMHALKQSADVFPPLKSVVSGAIAICEIAERTRHSKSKARALAIRVAEIMNVLADAVPDASDISPRMSLSIDRFSRLLTDIRCFMENMCLTSTVSRLMHLNRNECLLQDFETNLDDAYHDFLAASTLRLEVQQAQLALQQKQFAMQQARSQLELENISRVNTRLLVHSQVVIFLAVP